MSESNVAIKKQKDNPYTHTLGMVAISIACLLQIPAVDRYLDQTMQLHIIGQLLPLVVAGFIMGRTLFVEFVERNFIEYDYYGAGTVLFFVGSIIFWMIPRTLDLAVTSQTVDYVMQAELFFSAALLGAIRRSLPFTLKTGAGIYGLAMWGSMGYGYSIYNKLLCSVYDITMQQQTGVIILKLFPVWIIVFIYSFIRDLSVPVENKKNR